MKVFCFFFSAALPSLVWAECPAAGDLATGIEIVEEDGTVGSYREASPGIIGLTYRFEDGYAISMQIAEGLYETFIVDIEDGQEVEDTAWAFNYAPPPEELGVPSPGETVEFSVVERDVDGVRQGKAIYVGLPTETLSLGSCSYEITPISSQLRTNGPGGRTALDSVYYYFNELGFAHLYSDADFGEPPEVFSPIAIRVVQ